MSHTNLIHLLEGYSLTKNQAKILAVLTQTNGYLEVKQISQISNIARESIYAILLNLREMGFIQKTISKPEKFCVIPLKRILTFLHEKKSQDTHKLEVLTTQVLLENNQKAEIPQLNNISRFVLIPKKKQLENRVAKAFFNSKKSIKIITSWKRFIKGSELYNKALKNALSNGAILQILVSEKPQKALLSKDAKFFHDHPNTTIKYINSQTKIVEAIIDDQEIFLITNPNTELSESSALWSNNKSLIAAIKGCFELVCQIS